MPTLTLELNTHSNILKVIEFLTDESKVFKAHYVFVQL